MRFVEIKGWTPGYLNVAPHHLVILVKCDACGAEREFDRNSVPPMMRHSLISELEARLKCTACGAKNGRLRFGSYMA